MNALTNEWFLKRKNESKNVMIHKRNERKNEETQ